MINAISNRIEKRLYAIGFRLPEIRIMLRLQILICIAAIMVGAAASFVTLWPLWFAVGAILTTFNFFTLANFIQQVILQEYSRHMLIGLLFRFYGKLMLTGLVLFGLIAWVQVSISALASGLAVSMATMLSWKFTSKSRHNIKEA